MRRADARGLRVAIVADVLVNPTSAFYEDLAPRPGPVLDLLVDDGWGIMKAPPPFLSDEAIKASLATIAGDALEYRKHGHDVVVLVADGYPDGGLRLDLLEQALREVGEGALPTLPIRLDANCSLAELRGRLAVLTLARTMPVLQSPAP